MKHLLLVLFCLVLKPRSSIARQKALFRDFAPPALDTSNDADFHEFHVMTVSVGMGHGRWPAPKAAIETADFQALVDSYKESSTIIHGKALVNPNLNREIDWWVQQSNSLVELRMYKYIDTMVKSRKGDIWAWDVVNEAMADDYDDMDADGVRTSYNTGVPVKEYAALGQSFIAKAFHRAHAADPNALLLLTDYNCEEEDPSNNDEKSDRMFRFMQKLKSRNVPVHGVGLRFQVSSLPGSEPNYTRIMLNFQRFRNAGFSIFITELDVTSDATAKSVTRQAVVHSRIMKICLDEPACKSILMWEDAKANSSDPIQAYSLQPRPARYAMQSAVANFTAVYRVSSLLQPQTGYLARNGTSTTPSYEVRLYPLNNKTKSLAAMKWRFERVDVGIYRIRCTWGPNTGYLNRPGLWNPKTSSWDPANYVYAIELHSDWDSEQWYVTLVSGNQYRITNRWGLNGTLTRRQIWQNGKLVTTNQVILAAPNSKLSSQIWNEFRACLP